MAAWLSWRVEFAMSSYPISCRITREGSAIHVPNLTLIVKGLLFRTSLSSLCF